MSDEEEAGAARRRQARAAPGMLAWPWHPFLFAAASVLALHATNLRQATFADAAPALAGALAAALGFYLIFLALFRGRAGHAAVLASLWTAVALFHSGLFGRVNAYFEGGFAMQPTLPVAFAVLAVGTLAIWRARFSMAVPNIVLNVMAVALVADPAWRIASYSWQYGAVHQVYDADAAEQAIAAQAGEPVPSADHPDIYYFIFDRYASRATLAEHYDYDDSDLIADLEERGFYVGHESRSNYFKTGHSVASTFYMDYLDFLGEDERVPPSSWHPIHAMLDDHRVARFLKARGYDFVQFGSWWRGTFKASAADENRPHGFSEFNMLYLRRTILRPLFHALPESRLTMRLYWDNAQCQRVGPQIEEVKRVGEGRERPLFAFVHVLVPHGPYMFDREGNCLSVRQAIERGPRQGYVDQVAYAGNIIRDMMDTLLAEGRDPPIIIVSSDEGPFPERYRGRAPSWLEAEDFEIQIKTSILNAYYFPDGDYSALYRDITPVNTFRLIFNKYFGSDFEPLPDQIIGFPTDFRLYEFFDVTEKARGRREVQEEAGIRQPGQAARVRAPAE